MLEDADADNINSARGPIERAVNGTPIARCAVEMAHWDGLGERLGVSVAQLFDGTVHSGLGIA